jgi:hypothetical protein
MYEIADQVYDHESEKWEFEPGDTVVCELVDSDDGPLLTATGYAPSLNALGRDLL